jgi:NADH:ubiquinone oxidoreductase subunit E
MVERSDYMNRADIEEIVEKNGKKKAALIPVLQDVQDKYHYLPEDALRIVSELLCIPLIDVYCLATFYKSFSLTPRGKHLINVCLGTACHVRGAPKILEEVKRKLGIAEGETTEDKEYSLETVNCLGACALGPVVVVDDVYHGQMTIRKVSSLLKKLLKSAAN